ncbi:MAG: hypothetical protein PCFJNLEI_01660 [Verrucomicrobiae bacterium]|nr:hypothetical protein [Verrucomicrobiae bacterium]
MRARLKRYWFLIGMTAAIGGGFVFPETSRAYQRSGLVDWAIALVMFCGGLTLATDHILRQFHNWRAVLLSVLMMFVLAPLVIWLGCAPLWLFPGEQSSQLYMGFMILAAQSCTLGSGIVISTIARGNVPLALVITVLNSLLAAVLTPLILRLTLATQVSFDVLALTGKLALIIFLPVVLGQLARPVVARWLGVVPWLPALLTQLVILSLIFMAVGTAAEWLTRSPWLVLGLAGWILALHVAVLAVNYVTATLITRDQPSRRSLMLCASQKTLATGSYVWARHFVVNPLGGIPLLFYHVVQLVFDSLLAHWLARQDANPGRSSHVT